MGEPSAATLESYMRGAMEAAGLSINRTAKLAGFHGASLFYGWWSGRTTPSRPSLARVAAVLGVPQVELEEAAGLPAPILRRTPDVTVLALEIERLDAEVRALREELTDTQLFLQGMERSADLGEGLRRAATSPEGEARGSSRGR